MKFHHILKLDQEQLFDYIARRFPFAVIADSEYILVPGNIPLMLVAHLDTVHQTPVQTICASSGGKILMSPQGIGGDDRCGVWSLLQLYGSDLHPTLLFTCDEEIGGIGATALAQDWGLYEDLIIPPKLIVELDRKGSNDAVYYECYCPELEDYITSLGYKTEWGTYSDIVTISPTIGVASVNLSCGYYNAHTTHEYINVIEMYKTIHKVQTIIQDIDTLPTFKYESFTYADWEYECEDDSEAMEWKEYYKKMYGPDWEPYWLK